jgi:C4-dicarboxylate-specific signal transduction histidine kinase
MAKSRRTRRSASTSDFSQVVLSAKNPENVEASLEDLRTAQDRLVQTEKLASLGQLTAGIAHEIKNPLNFVNNFSTVSVELIDELREALGGVHLDSKLRAEISEIADTLQGNLDKVVQHGKRADAIVKNMLLHSPSGVRRAPAGRYQCSHGGEPQSGLSRCPRREAGLQYHLGEVL